MKNLSNYAFNASANVKRKWYASILDHLSSFIVTILLFFLVTMIFDSTPIVKNAQNRVMEAQNQLNIIVNSTYLDEITEQNTLKGTSNSTKEYVKAVTYFSLIKSGVDSNKLSNNIYTSNIRDSKIENEDVFYQYIQFKKNNKESFLNNDEIDYKDTLYQYTSTDIWIEIVDSPCLLLKEDAAASINRVLIDSYKNSDLEIYNTLYNGYYKLIENKIDEVINFYKPYIEQYKLYEDNANNIFYIRHYCLLISYMFSIFIIYFLIPLLFKDGITLSMKAFKQAIKKKDNNKYSLMDAVYRIIYNLLKNMLLLPLVFLVLYSISARPLLDTSLIFNIPLIFYPIFSIIIIIISFVFSCLKKMDNEMLDEILFKYRIVDINEFENKNE